MESDETPVPLTSDNVFGMGLALYGEHPENLNEHQLAFIISMVNLAVILQNAEVARESRNFGGALIPQSH